MRRLLTDLAPWRTSFDHFGLLYALTSAFYPLLNPDCFSVVASPGPLHTPIGHLALHLVLAAFIAVVPPWLRRHGQPAGDLRLYQRFRGE